MSEDIKTFYVVKWSLTKGIQRMELVLTDDGEYASSPRLSGTHVFVRVGREAFESESEAASKARSMAHNKLASIEKSRRKVLQFIQSLEGK